MSTRKNSSNKTPVFSPDLPLAVTPPQGRAMGPVVGLAIAPDDGHIWVLHMAGELNYGPPDGVGKPEVRLPPLVEYDAEGRFLRAWGGPDHLPAIDGRAQWPQNEETISIDAEGTIWLFGANKDYDHAVQRFTRDGELLLRIGQYGVCGNDESRDLLGCPTDAYHDVERREVYITDGYINHRVVVFNSDTGEFLRAWGAYGTKVPSAETGSKKSFNNPVHAISLGPDGYLYVCDRMNNRVQVFDAIGRREPRYIREMEIDVPSAFGSAFNIAFDPSGDYMFICDGNNGRLWTVDREAWIIVESFLGPPAPQCAELTETIHKIVADRAGNLLLARCARGVEKLSRL